ncbi:peptidase [Streptomyces zinciresistens K42]|uniref:Peptidase n=1 Tax=Streptomyces zinciresistens K42 TaxID=700597 RepID=G2G9F8_9ACTN|nr:LysM peptidoglycan-binding domain-containing M23 family metallopeptidase [Streptomyces zinciresistens]EGX59873.1 peptidase [Streptomyces zinciresistens K42]
MPAKGKHRRPKSLRFTRSIAVAGTGGAALALPLMGATGAFAAPAQPVTEKAVQSAPVSAKKAVEKKTGERQTAAKKTGVRSYSVKAGDYLAKIADEQNVSGGWQKLYSDNRDAVGSDPALIHPGLKLVLGGKKAHAESSKPSAATPSSAAKPSAKAHQETAPEKTAPRKTVAKAASAATASGFSAPTDSASVGTNYKVPGSMWSSGYHTGADFTAPMGTPLKAVGSGTVVSAGWAGPYGNQIIIRLADGYYAQYAHMSSLAVSSGQTVTAGQQLGLSGATGNVTGPHLHLEIRTTPNYGSDVDPVAYLRSKGVSIG